jgi:triosephosphate isomerase
MKNIIAINLKLYKEVFNKNLSKFLLSTIKSAKKENANLIIIPNNIDLKETLKICNKYQITVFAQNAESNIKYGSNTGHIGITQLKDIGCYGTLINHSENRLSKKTIEILVKECKEKKFKSIVCSKNLKETKEIAKFKPDFIAYEPPKLIGGDISVATAKPEVIKDCYNAIKEISPKTKLLVGAGVKTTEDVKISKKLKAAGVLLASGMTKSKTPGKTLKELNLGFK